jgi:RNA polymerase sigma-70 factor (ECF subfamily)
VNPDLALVRRMLDGDEAAFESFFNAVYPALYRFALARIGGDQDAAGDIAQAAICKAIAKLQTYRGEAALLTWVCVFCRREIYAHGRRNRERPLVELVEDEPEIRAALESLRAATMEDPDASLDRDKLATFVQRVLDQLPSHYADALEWKYIDELPVLEIGTRLGLSPKAAESLLTRARSAFRDAFHTLASATQPPVPETRHREG